MGAVEGGNGPKDAVGGTERATLGIEECPSVAPLGGLDFAGEEEAEAGNISDMVGELEYEMVGIGVEVDIEEESECEEGVLCEEVKADIAPEAVAEYIGVVGVFPLLGVEEQIGCVAEFTAGVSGGRLDVEPATEAVLVDGADGPSAPTWASKGPPFFLSLEANPT